MKKVLVVLAVMLLFLSCEKEEEDIFTEFIARGRVSDNLTNEPLPGILIQLNHDSRNYNNDILTLRTDSTDENGEFEMKVTLKFVKDYNLFMRIPTGNPLLHNYQGCNLSSIPVYQDAKNPYYYNIKLVRNTFFVPEMPVIPPEWENGRLILDFDNAVGSTGAPDYIIDFDLYYDFNLNDTAYWAKVLDTKIVYCGTAVNIEYTLLNGNTTKTGAFSVQCQEGDTTFFKLPLFD